MGQSGNTKNERRGSVECGSANKGNPLNCSWLDSSSNGGFSDSEEEIRRLGVNDTSPLLVLSRKSYENDRHPFAQGCFERERSILKIKSIVPMEMKMMTQRCKTI